jgi:DNA-binding transcriptional ArsR family regulator
MEVPGGGNIFIIVDKCVLVNSRFAKLDNARGSLRLLHILGNRVAPMSRSTFQEFAERSGVGKSAFYSSIRALRELGLIEEKRVMNKGVSLKVTELTPRGVSVAKNVSELFSDLSKG